jgi:hypothetical protein
VIRAYKNKADVKTKRYMMGCCEGRGDEEKCYNKWHQKGRKKNSS